MLKQPATFLKQTARLPFKIAAPPFHIYCPLSTQIPPPPPTPGGSTSVSRC